jgi:hypothetical protein
MEIKVIVIGNVEARARELGYQAEYDDVHRDLITSRWKAGGVTTIAMDDLDSAHAMDTLTRQKFSVYYAEHEEEM